MLQLLLAILCGALITLAMRTSERHRKNHLSMLVVNYVVCLLLALLHTGGAVSHAADGLGRSLLLGLGQGVLFLATFLLLQGSISKNGVVLSATFMRLGVLVPTLCAVLLFHERPTALQTMGFGAALAAILLISLERGQKKPASVLLLIALLLCGGVTDAMSKVFEQLGTAQYQELFLCCTFGAAMVLCLLLALVRRQRLAWADVLWGTAIAIPNYYSSRFLLLSLRRVPAIVAYPTFSVGAMILASLAGLVLFRERLSRRQWLSLIVILAALALLNL